MATTVKPSQPPTEGGLSPPKLTHALPTVMLNGGPNRVSLDSTATAALADHDDGDDDHITVDGQERVEIEHDVDYGCIAYCMDLTFLGNEPIRYLEERIIEAHRRLSANANADSNAYTVVRPKLSYKPRPRRTGSAVFITKKWGTVATVETVSTTGTSSSFGSTNVQENASLSGMVVDGGPKSSEDEIQQSSCAPFFPGSCLWGYFVDVPPEPPREPLPKAAPYRSFLSKEIEATSA